jgi:hypothetical protein
MSHSPAEPPSPPAPCAPDEDDDELEPPDEDEEEAEPPDEEDDPPPASVPDGPLDELEQLTISAITPRSDKTGDGTRMANRPID